MSRRRQRSRWPGAFVWAALVGSLPGVVLAGPEKSGSPDGGAPAAAASLASSTTSKPTAAVAAPTESAPARKDAASAESAPAAASAPPSATPTPTPTPTPTTAPTPPTTPPSTPLKPPELPQVKEAAPKESARPSSRRDRDKERKKSGRPLKSVPLDVILEAQNRGLDIARRYAQLLLSQRYDEARLMHEEEGGRRPDWINLSNAVHGFAETHGSPTHIDHTLLAHTGAELTTYFFVGRYADGSELPVRVAIDHSGNVSGAGVGPDAVPARRKRYDRNDHYKTRTELSLPFAGVFTATNATLGPGNGHYLNANQRFAIDFLIVEEVEPGKRKSYRERGQKNTDHFAYGLEVLAPADGVVVQAVDGIQDNPPGVVDVYYRLGNSVVLQLGNGEYAHLCHLMQGSVMVRPGDRVTRGQPIARVGNSGNTTGPHLHFQLTDGPLISHSASLPAYFRSVQKDGKLLVDYLPQSGDRLSNPPGSLVAPLPLSATQKSAAVSRSGSDSTAISAVN